MPDIELGRLFAETVEMGSDWQPVFRIVGRPVARAPVSADPADEQIPPTGTLAATDTADTAAFTGSVGIRIDDTGAAGDVTSPNDVGDRIFHVVSAFREVPHAGWVPVTVHRLVGSEFAFPDSVSAWAAVEGIDGPARLRFEDGTEVSYAIDRPSDGEDWRPLGLRAEQLGARDVQAVQIGVEPLLAAAQQLIDDLPPGEDSAELQSLVQATGAELRNPRPDSVMLERVVARLSAAVATQADADEAAAKLSGELGIDEAVAADTAEGLIALVRDQGLGDPDPDLDRDAATKLLEELSDRFAAAEAAIAEHLSAFPEGEVSERLTRIEGRLSESSGGGWPRAIGQNLVASAIWLQLFSVLGASGAALKALVWTIIAIYQVLGYG